MRQFFKNFRDYFSGNKKILIILFVIIALGIFLRSYNFYGFQRFDEDQVRDMLTVEKIDQDKNFIILGPAARYSEYHLGPIYYYFTYISFKMFGENPGSLAYPALFFSILSIPLFYLVLKIFFSEFISLAITAIYAVSFNSVEFSRFEWNCNLIPFFILAFIYILTKIISQKNNSKIIWPALFGIIIGIGVQLHTIIIFIFLPIIAIYFTYFFFKKYPVWKSFAVIFLIAIFLNIPAIIWDISHKGENIQSLFKSASGGGSSLVPSTGSYWSDLKCYTQGNSYVLSPLNQNSSCGMFFKRTADPFLFYLVNLILVITFFAGAVGFLFYFIKREKDPKKKAFLQIIILYFVLSFIVFLPMANIFDKRYFIISSIISFIFLGFWLKMLSEKFKVFGIISSFIIVLSLFISGALLTKRVFISNPNPYKIENEYIGIDLKKAEKISNDIATLSLNYPDKKLYISSALYMRGYQCVIKYFSDKKNLGLEIIADNGDADKNAEKNSIIFFVKSEKKAQPHDYFDPENYSLMDTKSGENYVIWAFEKNN